MLYYLKGQTNVLSSKAGAAELVYQLAKQTYALLGTSTTVPISQIDEYKDNTPKRNFAVIDFDLTNFNAVRQKLVSAGSPRSIIIKISDSRARLVLDLDELYNRKSYKKAMIALYSTLNLPITKRLTDLTKEINFKPFDQKDILFSANNRPYHVNQVSNSSSNNLSASSNPDALMPDKQKLLAATQSFLQSKKASDILHDRQKATSFFDALANTYLNGQVDASYIRQTLQYITNITQYDISNWQKLMNERLDLLRNNPDMQEIAPPFGQYIRLYEQARVHTNLAGQLRATLPKNMRPSADFDLSEAAQFIEMTYPPYLLNQPGDDIDNLVIFDATTGIWTHNSDIMYSLLTAIRPYTTRQQLDTFLRTFAAKARNANRFIDAYHGSRYLLFNNCVLDVMKMEQIDLSDPIVRDLHFTERCHIDLNYVNNPALPSIPERRLYDNGPWNPKDFLMAYANNDQDAYNYLLCGFAFGLFGGHNFGVHFDIQGESRWGKSTLVTIFNSLYDNRTVTIPFPNLNTQFPFTSYPADTSIIWLDESNEGVEPLDDEHGTITYDTLADNEARFQVKNKGDMILANPPQVYITGTQFIKAQELYTGPAGRTLAFKLPAMTDALRNQSYSNAITECLSDESVLQWLVYNFIMAYKEIVPASRMDDLRINLANKKDLSLFPSVAQEWRKEFVVGGSSIDDWFADEIEPYLSSDPKQPTYLHERVLYAIYLDAYRLANPNDPYGHQAKTTTALMKRLKTIWASEDDKFVVNYQVGSIEKGRKMPRKSIKDPDKMNFDWHAFDADYTRPSQLDSPGYNNLKLFGKKSSGWIAIYKK